MSSRRRTSSRMLPQRGTLNPPQWGAQRGHCTVHYLPKGVIIRSPAERERAGREPERGLNWWSPPPPALSHSLLTHWWIVMWTPVLQNVWTTCCFRETARDMSRRQAKSVLFMYPRITNQNAPQGGFAICAANNTLHLWTFSLDKEGVEMKDPAPCKFNY